MIGRIETVDGGVLESAKVVVELLPAGRDSRSLRLRQTNANAYGFFHFEDVAQGAYVLQVAAPGYLEAIVPGIEVFDGFEAELSRPVTLDRPAALTLQLNPAQTADGDHWNVDLVPLRHGSDPTHDAIRGQADLSGLVHLMGLTPGPHLLALSEPGGGVVVRRELEVFAGDGYEHVELDLILIRGKLKLGEEPLAGVVTFGGRGGTAMATDEDGKFTGSLDRDGSWRVIVEAETPKISRRIRGVEVRRGKDGFAEVEIELPDTRLLGRVVHADGSLPEKGALVDFRPLTRDDEKSTVRSDRVDGVFEIIGVPESPLALRARTSSASSDEVIVEVSVDSQQFEDVVLVLREKTTVRGTVRAEDGVPVPGAKITLRPAGGLASLGGSASSDDSGAFSLEIPAEADAVYLWIEAQGFAFDTRLLNDITPERSLDLIVRRTTGTLAIGYLPGAIGIDSGHGLFLRTSSSYLTHSQLSSWAVRQNGGRVEDGTMVVPRLAPGAYYACMLEIGGDHWLQFFLDPTFIPSTCHGLSIEPGGITDLHLDEQPTAPLVEE